MVCIYCKNSTSVVNSRLQKTSNQVWRRRYCGHCGATFTTHEAPDHEKGFMFSNSEEKLAPFRKEKLFLSILKTCEHRDDALNSAIALTDTVMAKIMNSLSTGSVAAETVAMFAFSTLQNFDRASAVQYAAYHPQYNYDKDS